MLTRSWTSARLRPCCGCGRRPSRLGGPRVRWRRLSWTAVSSWTATRTGSEGLGHDGHPRARHHPGVRGPVQRAGRQLRGSRAAGQPHLSAASTPSPRPARSDKHRPVGNDSPQGRVAGPAWLRSLRVAVSLIGCGPGDAGLLWGNVPLEVRGALPVSRPPEESSTPGSVGTGVAHRDRGAAPRGTGRRHGVRSRPSLPGHEPQGQGPPALLPRQAEAWPSGCPATQRGQPQARFDNVGPDVCRAGVGTGPCGGGMSCLGDAAVSLEWHGPSP